MLSLGLIKVMIPVAIPKRTFQVNIDTYILLLQSIYETFEKFSFLPAQLNPYLTFNRGSSSSLWPIGPKPPEEKAKILTRGIHLVF